MRLGSEPRPELGVDGLGTRDLCGGSTTELCLFNVTAT